jgi:hypothetical protein
MNRHMVSVPAFLSACFTSTGKVEQYATVISPDFANRTSALPVRSDIKELKSSSTSMTEPIDTLSLLRLGPATTGVAKRDAARALGARRRPWAPGGLP